MAELGDIYLEKTQSKKTEKHKEVRRPILNCSIIETIAVEDFDEDPSRLNHTPVADTAENRDESDHIDGDIIVNENGEIMIRSNGSWIVIRHPRVQHITFEQENTITADSLFSHRLVSPASSRVSVEITGSGGWRQE